MMIDWTTTCYQQLFNKTNLIYAIIDFRNKKPEGSSLASRQFSFIFLRHYSWRVYMRFGSSDFILQKKQKTLQYYKFGVKYFENSTRTLFSTEFRNIYKTKQTISIKSTRARLHVTWTSSNWRLSLFLLQTRITYWQVSHLFVDLYSYLYFFNPLWLIGHQ